MRFDGIHVHCGESRSRYRAADAVLAEWLFSLAGRWFDCIAVQNGGGISIIQASEDIVGGMSGTPIVVDDGSAIGVLSSGSGPADEGHRKSPLNPRIAGDLPGRLLIELGIWPRPGE